MDNDMITIAGRTGSYTYGRDEHGEYGSLAAPESDSAIPEPVELLPTQPAES